jgi:hypothetical protein
MTVDTPPPPCPLFSGSNEHPPSWITTIDIVTFISSPRKFLRTPIKESSFDGANCRKNVRLAPPPRFPGGTADKVGGECCRPVLCSPFEGGSEGSARLLAIFPSSLVACSRLDPPEHHDVRCSGSKVSAERRTRWGVQDTRVQAVDCHHAGSSINSGIGLPRRLTTPTEP